MIVGTAGRSDLRHLFVGLIALALFLPAGAGLGYEPRQEISAGAGRLAGAFAYEITFTVDGVNNGSRLEFPLNVPIAYAAGNWVVAKDEKGTLVFGGNGLVSLNDPRGVMTDEDVIAGYLVGYTESSMELDMWSGGVDLRRWYSARSVTYGEFAWWWGGAYQYDRYHAEVYGAEGYYFPPIGTGPISLDPAVRALTYDLEAHALMGGAGLRFGCERFCTSLSLEGGLAYMNDLDQHELRNFYAEAEGVGAAVRVAGSARLWLGAIEDTPPSWFIDAAVSFYGVTTWGTQTQSHPGETFSGIADVLQIQRSSVTASIGYAF